MSEMQRNEREVMGADGQVRRTQVNDEFGAGEGPHGTVLDEQTTTTNYETFNGVLRGVAAVAAAVAVVWAIVALLRIDWNDGINSAAVDVGGIAFTPLVAIVTLVAGLIALMVGAARDRTSKLAVGAILSCVGLGILIAGEDNRSNLDVESGHGWLALIIGVVLLATGLAIRTTWETRRQVRTDRY